MADFLITFVLNLAGPEYPPLRDFFYFAESDPRFEAKADPN